MDIVSYFFIAFLLSALGTIPIGLITLTIMQRTLTAGKKAGFLLALGATIPEFFYTYLALFGLAFFRESFASSQYIQIGAMFVFFAFGCFYFFKKSEEPKMESIETKYDYLDFGRGLLIGTMNMLIIPFWILIGAWLSTYDMVFDLTYRLLSFSLGAALGAFLVFIAYVELGNFMIPRLKSIALYTNKIVGSIFLLLGFYQLTQLM